MEACAEWDLDNEYTLLDKLEVVNSIRGDVVTEKALANQPSGRSTVRVRSMQIDSQFATSRDWFELFYDSRYAPPKFFHLVMQWMHFINYNGLTSA